MMIEEAVTGPFYLHAIIVISFFVAILGAPGNYREVKHFFYESVKPSPELRAII